MRYVLTCVMSFSTKVHVDAQNVDEAIDKANLQIPPTLCQECSRNLEVGFVTEWSIRDSEGRVLDRG